MEKHFVDISLENGETCLAKIVEVKNNSFIVKFLSETSKTYEDCKIYKFDKDKTEIEKECVSGYYDTGDIEATGFTKIEDVGYILKDDLDDDYEPSDSDESDESDVSDLSEESDLEL